MSVTNDKYPIKDMEFSGVIFSVSPTIPFKNGEGAFRNAVLTVDGVYGDSYVPFLLFGEDAANIDESAAGRPARVLLRLSSRQYEDRTGSIRWNIGFTCRSITLAAPTIPVQDVNQTQRDASPDTSLASDPDDIPF